MASPFGIALITLAVTYYLNYRPPIDHFGEMAHFASISAVIYGMFAVIAETIGGSVMFYTMYMIGKAIRKIKEENDQRAVQRVNSNPALQNLVLEAAGISTQERNLNHTEPVNRE